jgi:hypothetical protein
MLFIQQTEKSPKVNIDFTQVLFEVSGTSCMEDPSPFYNHILEYISSNFYEVQQSTYYPGKPNLVLHFYMRNIGWNDIEMIRKIDAFLFSIDEFKTAICWYYNPAKNVLAEKAFFMRDNCLNRVRLVEDSVHV